MVNKKKIVLVFFSKCNGNKNYLKNNLCYNLKIVVYTIMEYSVFMNNMNIIKKLKFIVT